MTHTAPWRSAAASVVGVSHQRTGTPCQDAHAVEVLANGILVVAVADGAGSARHSAVGARVAIDAAIGSLSRALMATSSGPATWSTQLTQALAAAQEATLEAADEMTVEARELASTLLLVVADGHQVAAAQVGDGAVVVRWPDARLETLSAPQHGEHLNETVFLTAEGAVTGACHAHRGQGPAAIAVFTDGIERLALSQPGATPNDPFFTPLFRFIATAPSGTQADATLTTFLASPRVTARADDDLTLVLATRAP